MIKILAKIIMKIAGWKVVGSFPPETKKAIVIAAAHTSNWDFLYTRCAAYILNIKLNYTIKKEFLVFPIGPFMKSMGAIPIDRSVKNDGEKRQSMTDYMADLFNKREELIIVITPEGTRSYNEEWKTGFYYLAKKTNIPVFKGFVDYKKKEAGIAGEFELTDDVNADIERLKDFYRGIHAKYPEQSVR